MLVAAFVTCLPPAYAQNAAEGTNVNESQGWALALWGLSYHFNRSIDYNAGNWGVGIRDSVHHQVFFETDALRNSYKGLLVPVSVGYEHEMFALSDRCDVSAVAAFTVAYYQNPVKNVAEIRFGPLPAVAVGCGRFKANTIVVLGASRQPVVALATSLTIAFRSP